MGLDRITLAQVAPHIKGADILCLGYPDVVMHAHQVKEILGVMPTEFTNAGVHHKLDHQLPETKHVLMLAGARSVRFIDIVPSRGCEQTIDLNKSIDGWGSRYELVIDGGTLEHCMNFGQALKNAWDAVAIGGHIVHVSPLSMVNHGFFNFCPTLLWDFYNANGGAVLDCSAYDRLFNSISIDPYARFKMPNNGVLYTYARKIQNVFPTVWPIQTRYKDKK